MIDLALIAESVLSGPTALKLLLLFVVAYALLALARRAGRQGDEPQREFLSPPPEIPGLTSAPARLPEAATPTNRFGGFAGPDLGPVRIVNLNFATFDADAGPPEADVFADELFVELYKADTGHKWTQSYFVASPRGLERLLKDKQWDSVFAHDTFVFRHYDLADIRRTITEHIAEEQKLVLPDGPPADEG